ncbi:hypothetical protein FHS52_001131 [Erythromicrobium ramosum]|uniref:Uncharacterized protein n=1 Tax=Erythrobacter ramosus TaxID=35811 RepID=A0A6I4UHR8_9SPHN|nr:hypothetical protein [Erythrobacter ramosus]MBB3775188.1 hypothetical protein [Erythrobacter ramosus]MXP37187.1 hypothetical protein [Erythrobacter ramosus]
MSQNTSLEIGTNWDLLTDADVTEVTFQNIGSEAIYVIGTSGDDEPDVDALGVQYGPGEGEAKCSLANLFPGVSGVNRLWAKAIYQNTIVFVSHA